MTNQSLQIKAVPLRLALKTTIRHAAATRNEGESIWVQAKRRDHTGYGEGCPRAYVAGDELTSSLTWVRDNFPEGRVNFATRDDLSEWAFSHGKVIDQYPAAWCAVEMAVLDLLAREKGCPVENLLGLSSNLYGRYTAVLGDDKVWTYTTLADSVRSHFPIGGCLQHGTDTASGLSI